MNIERRKFPRYQVPINAIFLYSNYSPVKGWVKDISKGGMSFEYTPSGECEPKPEISIILMGDKLPLYLPDISCKTIYDIRVDQNNRPFKITGIRRYGVQYEKLEPEMQEKLTFLFKSDVVM